MSINIPIVFFSVSSSIYWYCTCSHVAKIINKITNAAYRYVAVRIHSFVASTLSHRPIMFTTMRPCFERERRETKRQKDAWDTSRMSREDGKGPRVTARAGFSRRYVRYMCLYVCVRAVWFQDALSNVLFISVEQSLPVYPEDILRWSRCVRNATALPRAASLHLKLSQLTSVISEHDNCRMFILNFSQHFYAASDD